MMWSNKFCFVHITRTGGTILTDAFGHLPFVSKDVLHNKHAPGKRARSIVGPANWDRSEFYKFCLLRDPWDIVCSWFEHIQNFDGFAHCTPSWAHYVNRCKKLGFERFIKQEVLSGALVPYGGFWLRYCNVPDIEVLASPRAAAAKLAAFTGFTPKIEFRGYRTFSEHELKEAVHRYYYKDLEILCQT